MRIRPGLRALFSAVCGALLLLPPTPTSAAPAGAPAQAAPPTTATGPAGAQAARGLGEWVLAGTGSRSVLPTLGGTTAYLLLGVPGPKDPTSLGVFVPRWDQGRVAVGNGDEKSFWVHDDVRVRALALTDLRTGREVVLVSADLYMIFKTDGDEIRDKVAQKLGRRLDIMIAATHNHHGPDTAFDVNHAWYEHMTNQAADAVVDAVRFRQPARLRVASGTHYFGAKDGTDPVVYDPRLNVLQATRLDGKPLATVVQWNNHPESTLGWKPPVPPAQCVVLVIAGENCNTEGRYLTADFPGVLADVVKRRVGGEVLYFNGALGLPRRPRRVAGVGGDAAHPLGQRRDRAARAVGPGGGADLTARNFRRAALIGEQLAEATLRVLAGAEPIAQPRLSYREEPVYTRLSNAGFRHLLTPTEQGRPRGLGHNLTPLYTCPATGPKNAQTCVSDGTAVVTDPVVGPMRVGDHLRTVVGYLEVGPTVALVALPGEVPGELVVGLPAQFRTAPQRWYEEPRGRHAYGDAFRTPGTCWPALPGGTSSRWAWATTRSGTRRCSATTGSSASRTS
jgi:hypothetical protein